MKNSTKLGLITGFTVGIAALAYYDSCIKKEVEKKETNENKDNNNQANNDNLENIF